MSGLIPTQDKLKKIAIDSAMTTAGAAGVAFGSQKLLDARLGIPMDLKGLAMMTVAIGVGTLVVNYLEEKMWIPDS